ncbi:DUF5661 family protein [Clostridium cibarium]|uniref:DUF5661 family protein n=1 Tax=Clostridium cibarium TaxID=2762247 RepID=UPI001FAE585F|nr:DUF5661 family protein [Clostridium cibarium]
MYFCMPSNNYNNISPLNSINKTSKPLEETLHLINKTIQEERKNKLLHDYLITTAPNEKEKNIINAIKTEENKHSKFFKEIYAFYTCQNVHSQTSTIFERPKSYIYGIMDAKLNTLDSVDVCRDIKSGIPHVYYKDMIREILMDKLKNSQKYDYILFINLINTSPVVYTDSRNISPSRKNFTTDECAQIAKELGIDFSKEKFDLEQFTMGINTELEHGKKYSPTNVTDNDPLITGKIALAHLHEFPDYYTRLSKLENDAKAYWTSSRCYLRQVKEFTLNELSEYDGTLGKPAYVAVNGIVYDVSKNPHWNASVHHGLTAGKDLSFEFSDCHGKENILKILPKVGILKV